MPRDEIPPEAFRLAEERAVARRAHDWATADRLKAELAAAGWKVIDAGTLYSLERAAAPDVEADGVVRYGSSASVPSRLGDAEVGVATVVLVLDELAGDLHGTIDAVRAGSPDRQVVVVAGGATATQDAAPGALPDGVEIVRLAGRPGRAAALNAGIRRASAGVVVILDGSLEAGDDLVGALARALEDPAVAVAGPLGVASDDLRHFTAAPESAGDVLAIGGAAMAFRRADYVARGPLDEHFASGPYLDVWWSLVLRDFAEDDPDGAGPRRAVQVAGVPVTRHAIGEAEDAPAGERDRLARKNLYRLLKRFASRRDLLVGVE
jgi:hypothetical protein